MKAKRMQPHRTRQKERSSRLYPYRLMIRNLNLREWTKWLSWTIGGLFFVGILAHGESNGDPGSWFFSDLVFGMALFLVGCLGFLWFYRREMYVRRRSSLSYEMFRGGWAQINGIGLMVLGWGLLVGLVYYVLIVG